MGRKRTPAAEGGPVRGAKSGREAESAVPAGWNAAGRAEFRTALRAWFAERKRDLPWRRTADPYRIWVSETMLQQTQVVTAIPYYERFLARFPTAADLAAADEQEVLRLWEGLGYYRRARHLHAAAREIVDRHGGEFPRDFEAVLALPGVGRYTAGAVLSFAFGTRLPILEANTRRLLARLLALEDDPRTTAAERRLWEFAERLLPEAGPEVGDLNQALMELGSLTCTPRSPECGACPVRRWCGAFAAGLQHEIPPPAKRPTIEAVQEAAVVVRRGPCVLLQQRRADERWAGLWDFVRFPFEQDLPLARDAEEEALRLSAGTAREAAVAATDFRPRGTRTHGVTRFRFTLHCFEAEWTADLPTPPPRTARWAEVAELPSVPLNAVGRRIAEGIAPR